MDSNSNILILQANKELPTLLENIQKKIKSFTSVTPSEVKAKKAET